MKELTFEINDFGKTANQLLKTVFMYIISYQLEQANLSTKCVIPYSVMQGKVILECEQEYDEIKATQLVFSLVHKINLFSVDNQDFINFTTEEKEQLKVLLASTCDNRLKQNYYRAIKELRKLKLYPPISMQKTLVAEAATFDIIKNTMPKVSDVGLNIKQGDLQTGSWLWSRVVEKIPANPFKKEASILAGSLAALGIEGIEELQLLTSTYHRFIMHVGTAKCCRLALQSEVENVKNIKNIFSKRFEIYNTQLDKYLTVMCSVLLTNNLTALSVIYEILNNINCTIPFDLRLPDLKELAEVSNKTISFRLIEDKWIKIICANEEIIKRILTTINENVKNLYVLWQDSRKKFDYPENLDSLQVYYENQNIDIDELNILLSIDAEEGNITQMLTTIKNAEVRCEYDKLPYDIAVAALKKKTSLTEKQLAIIEKRYNSILRTQELSKFINADECVNIATELLNKFGHKLNPIVKNIAQQTLRYGICSERQLEVLRLSIVTLNTELELARNNKLNTNTVEQNFMFSLPATLSNPTLTQNDIGEQDVQDTQNNQYSPVNQTLIKDTQIHLIEDAYKQVYGENFTPSTELDINDIWID